MKDLKETAEKWAKFKQRQNRIYQRNLNSDERFENMKGLSIYNYGGIMAIDDRIMEKDMYPKSFEGMLEWMNDGEPD
jgi:hypothetical protein